MMTLKQISVNNQYSKVKKVYSLQVQEKELIKNSFGRNTTVPQIIFDRIQKNLDNGQKVNAILKVALKDGNSYWINNNFTPGHYNSNNQFSINSDVLDETEVNKVKKLYNTLYKIETNLSVTQANKFLDGYLENYNLTFNQLTSLN